MSWNYITFCVQRCNADHFLGMSSQKLDMKNPSASMWHASQDTLTITAHINCQARTHETHSTKES